MSKYHKRARLQKLQPSIEIKVIKIPVIEENSRVKKEHEPVANQLSNKKEATALGRPHLENYNRLNRVIRMNICLSVVIPTYNRAYKLDNCLASLFKQNYSRWKYEVIVIDDNSNDETQKVTNKYSKKYPNLKVIKNKKNMGPYYGRNLGAKLSKGPVVVFTDDDCKFPLDWLLKIEKAFQNPEVSCVQGTQKYRGKNPDLEAEGEFYLRMLQKRNGLDTKNLAIRKDLILKHKFDEAIKVTGDGELGLRLAMNRVTIKYEPDIWVAHLPNYSFKDHISRAKIWGINYSYIHQMYGWTCVDSRLRYPFPLLFFFYLGSSLYFLIKFQSFRKTITFVLMLLAQATYFKISIRKKNFLRTATKKNTPTFLKKMNALQNLLRAHWGYRSKVAKCNYPPVYLWIEPTNVCNLRCTMCPQSLPRELQPKKGYMSFDLFKKIIDEAESFVWEISLFLGGESLLHKDLARMIKYAKSKNLKVRLHTNATLLNQHKSKELIKSGLDLISFSVDGYTKEIYERLRVKGNFETTLNNIINFLRAKKEMASKKPYTILQFLEQIEPNYFQNNQSLETFLGNFEYFAPDEYRIVRAHNWAGTMSEIGVRPVSIIYSPCRFIWFAMVIAWDGTVIPCCDDLLYRHKIGNVKDNDLLSLWNNEKMVFLRKKIAKGRYQDIELCAKCNKLWMRKNNPQLIIPYGDIMSRVIFGHEVVGKLKKIFSDKRTIFSG